MLPKNEQAMAAELGNLLATETRSLARHLDEAKPHLTPRSYRLWSQLRHLTDVSQEHAQRLSQIATRLELSLKPGVFRQVVANFHYVSLEAVIPALIEEKQKQIDAYLRAVEHSSSVPAVRDELLALLNECQQQLAELEAAQRALS